MARKERHKKLRELTQHYLSAYYIEKAEQQPATTTDHIKLANKIIEDYRHEIETWYKEWDSEEAKGKLKAQIEFLTGIYAKQEKEKTQKEKVEAFKNKVPEVKARNIIW